MHAEALIRAGGATLAFDTNAIVGFSRADRRVVFGAFLTLCDDAQRLREHPSMPLAVAIVVPSLARMEGLHDLRVDRGTRPFDPSAVKAALSSKGAHVAPFDEDAAINTSGALHRWFPTHDHWHAAKRDRCLEVLGLSRDAAPGQSGLASIDWPIAAQAETERWILVTDDTRAEFRNVVLKLTRTALRGIFNDLLRERNLAPPART